MDDRDNPSPDDTSRDMRLKALLDHLKATDSAGLADLLGLPSAASADALLDHRAAALRIAGNLADVEVQTGQSIDIETLTNGTERGDRDVSGKADKP